MGSGKLTFTLLEASTSDFTAMKLLVLALVVGPVSSLPRKDRKPKEPKEEMEEKEKEDPRIIMRCLAENWEYKNGTEGINEVAVQDCRDCFMNIGESEDSLGNAKKCVAQYLPKEHKKCGSEIDAFQSWDDEEKGKELIKCFDETLELENNKECLKQAPDAEDIDEKITDATMCVMKSWKYGMAYVKKQMMDKGGKGKGKRPRKGKKREKKGAKKAMMMKLLTKAHCDLESEGDTTQSSDCFKCFANAVKKSMGTNGRGKKEMSPDMSSEVAACADTHLKFRYSKCNTMMKNKADKKETLKCYIRVLIKHEVGKCSSNIGDDITPEELTDVLECGKENVKEWVKNNASPKEAKKIADFLDDDDEDDDDMEG